VNSNLRDQLQRTLGDAYTLDRELGGGGMSRVFVATEHALGRQVVVKVLPTEMAGQVSVDRFKREIALAARLQHPHIVPLLTAGDAGGLPFFTMPLVEGESLRARLAKHGEFPLNEAVRLLREIAAALAYAHEHGIVHRDIKPDNVLLSGGSAMVTDFGVAKALTASSNAEQNKATSLGIALGTPAYMAPEQASADPNVDHRADIYAFGVLAYELLTGQPPFVGRTPQNLLAAHVTEAPEAITKRRATIPPALAAMVMRCLEKRAADRPQTANELVHALDQINTPSGGTMPTNVVPAYWTPQPAVVASSGRARMVGTVVGIVAIVAAAWFAVSRGGGAAKPRSIAVLPTDIGADTAHAYLADGLSNELTTKLSKIPGLSVRAYSSSRVMRGKGAREAGKELGVASVLTANMTRAGSRLRVTASLVNAADENVIWSETFEESDQDQFALQDKLVTAIAGALRLSLSPATHANITARGTTSSAAHDLVQRSRFLTDQFTDASIRTAIVLADSAIRLDSTYADAWAALANAWGELGDDFAPPRETVPKYREAVRRAVALEPGLADAHGQLANLLYWYEYDIPGAAREFERALTLDSANAIAGRFYPALLARSLALRDSAGAVAERAMRLNPLSRGIWTSVVLYLRFDRISPDSGRALCDRAGRVGAQVGAVCTGWRLIAARDFAGAREAFRRTLDASPSGGAHAFLAVRLAFAGDTAGVRAAIDSAIAHSRTEYVREDFIARAYFAVGNVEASVRWWQRAAESNSSNIVLLASDAAYEPLRSDPRIQAIVKRVKLK
jgi:serine/threonine-protein kinase